MTVLWAADRVTVGGAGEWVDRATVTAGDLFFGALAHPGIGCGF